MIFREANLRDPLPDVGDHGSYAVYPVCCGGILMDLRHGHSARWRAVRFVFVTSSWP
jgi:hypothetical protein